MPDSASSPAYVERWTAPLRTWLLTLVVALVVAATLHGGRGGAAAVVPYAVAVPTAVLGLLVVSRHRVRVADGMLQVPGARIGLDQIGGVTPLDRTATRRQLGPLAEPRAFVATRGWLGQTVRVQIEDPEDDTPYWLVGTRHPARLVAALQRR